MSSLSRSRRGLALAACALFLWPAATQADEGLHAVKRSLSLAQPCSAEASCLFTWTLTTRLGHALAFAEERYGPRDRNWTLLGVEFAQRDSPQVWYPTYRTGSGAIVIQITNSASRDEKRALFQLAHEVIHILSPAGANQPVTVLEEGLATYNSLEYLNEVGFPTAIDYIASARYENAYRHVAQLARHPGFRGGIKALRSTHGSLAKVAARDVQAAFPGISMRLAQALTRKF